MLEETDFLNQVWSRLSSEISESPLSNRELSRLCGKGPNYINTAGKGRSDIGIYAFYAICERLSLDASGVLGIADRVVVTDRTRETEEDSIDALLEAAQKILRKRADYNIRPTIDHILSSWRTANQNLKSMDSKVLSFCDVYSPPKENDILEIESIGVSSLTAEVLQSTDVDLMNRNLANSSPEISRVAAHIQRDVMKRQYVMTIKTLDTPLLNGKRLSIIYDQLNMLVFNANSEPRILVYPKYVAQL